MSNRMPTDEVTGLPHLILPINVEELFSPDGVVNYHHHFYNRRHPDLVGEMHETQDFFSTPENIPLEQLAGLAVRMSRGQRLVMSEHVLAHATYPLGPELPHTLDEKFTTAVKACAGLVSRFAIDLTSPDPDKLVYMSDAEFLAFTSPKFLSTERVHVDGPADTRRRLLGNFFLRYAIHKGLHEVSPHLIQRFLEPRSEAERTWAGNFILREAMEVSLGPVLPRYNELRRGGLVHPSKPELPRLIRKYIHPHRRQSVFPLLQSELAA